MINLNAIKARAEAAGGTVVLISRHDALALIAEVERLNAENERLKLQRPIEVDENTVALACECSRLKQQLATVTAERDAAVEDVYASANDPYSCGICKKRHIKCEANPDGSCDFEWRGKEQANE